MLNCLILLQLHQPHFNEDVVELSLKEMKAPESAIQIIVIGLRNSIVEGLRGGIGKPKSAWIYLNGINEWQQKNNINLLNPSKDHLRMFRLNYDNY